MIFSIIGCALCFGLGIASGWTDINAIGATRKTGGSNWGYKPLTLTRA